MKWPKLNQISIGFGSKLEVPEECLELVRVMRGARPELKSNIARCRHWFVEMPQLQYMADQEVFGCILQTRESDVLYAETPFARNISRGCRTIIVFCQ